MDAIDNRFQAILKTNPLPDDSKTKTNEMENTNANTTTTNTNENTNTTTSASTNQDQNQNQPTPMNVSSTSENPSTSSTNASSFSIPAAYKELETPTDKIPLKCCLSPHEKRVILALLQFSNLLVQNASNRKLYTSLEVSSLQMRREKKNNHIF